MPDQSFPIMQQPAISGSPGAIKRLLGELPFTAEIYWQLRQRGAAPTRGFSMHRIESRLPQMTAHAETACKNNLRQFHDSKPRVILIFVTLRYWIEHGSLMALLLAGLGHKVTLLFLPYARWDTTPSRFDIRRLNAYANKVLSQVDPLVHPISLLDIAHMSLRKDNHLALPKEIVSAIEQVSLRDTQYTLQIEEIDLNSDNSPSGNLYRLRHERNLLACRSLLDWLNAMPLSDRPDLILTPNGSILEMGAVFQVAQYLGIPAITYEFGEQRGRIWLAQNAEVMRQETGELWRELENIPLNDQQLDRVRSLYSSRQNGSLWENFGRLWQGLPLQGEGEVRQSLSLDERPVVLLAANVIGDSLTLGRQVFSRNMTEWLQFTVRHFSLLPGVQLVVRVHPGERYTKGPSVAEVVRQALPQLPGHIHLVQADDPINTYDLIGVSDLGLVYTTTVGMEMAMSGVPAIVSGATHYRNKGFTLDPASWQEFTSLVEKVLKNPKVHRLQTGQMMKAWQYAYRFYFNFPCPFPWHLLDFGESIDVWSMERTLSAEGMQQFGNTFSYLAGKPRDWSVELQ
jgi:hypothetical protein